MFAVLISLCLAHIIFSIKNQRKNHLPSADPIKYFTWSDDDGDVDDDDLSI